MFGCTELLQTQESQRVDGGGRGGRGFEADGMPTEYPECLVIEQNPDGLINRVSVFINQVGN